MAQRAQVLGVNSPGRIGPMRIPPFVRDHQRSCAPRRPFAVYACGLTLLALVLFFTAACMCGEDDSYSLESPKATRVVVVSVRSCGATTGYETVVSERRSWF